MVSRLTIDMGKMQEIDCIWLVPFESELLTNNIVRVIKFVSSDSNKHNKFKGKIKFFQLNQMFYRSERTAVI